MPGLQATLTEGVISLTQESFNDFSSKCCNLVGGMVGLMQLLESELKTKSQS